MLPPERLLDVAPAGVILLTGVAMEAPGLVVVVVLAVKVVCTLLEELVSASRR